MKKLPDSEYLVLTPTEERVIKFLSIRNGGSSISIIAKEVGLARTSIYNATASLMHKKLLRKNRFIYLLSDTGLLTRKKTVNDAQEQIRALMNETLTLKRGEILYSIESDEEIEYLFRKEGGLPEWQQAITNKGIVLKGVGSTEALALVRSLAKEPISKHIKQRSGAARFTADEIRGSCILISFRDSIIFFSRKKNYFYRIDNADIARFTQGVIDTMYLQLRYHPLIKD